VADLGQPGTGPPQYADLIERAVPLLHPDLVVVGVLQGDDLHQSTRPDEIHTGLQHLLSRPLEELFPDLQLWVTQRTIMHTQQTDIVWRAEIARLERTLDAQQRSHLQTISPAIRQAWTSGRLNPGSFVLGVIYPDYFESLVDLQAPFTQMQIRNMGDHLLRIRRAVSAEKCRVLALAVPWGIFMSPADQANFARCGFEVDPRMLSTDSMDQAIAQACRQSDIPFVSVTPAMRAHCREARLFYPLDGHFNADGNRIFAAEIAPAIEKALR
jgi:lysophospholipase L1-like esterase